MELPQDKETRFYEPLCEAGGEHDWDLGAMGPDVALMYCTKCPWSVSMRRGHQDKYIREER